MLYIVLKLGFSNQLPNLALIDSDYTELKWCIFTNVLW